jgi:formylglycine-generating enzyme required for sulfatase activity
MYSGKRVSLVVSDGKAASVNEKLVPKPVATKQSNNLGLYDMTGNVWEWCWDRYGGYNSRGQSNPAGAASGSHRVFRGGSWYNSATSARVSHRRRSTPDLGRYDLGFRLVLPAVQ